MGQVIAPVLAYAKRDIAAFCSAETWETSHSLPWWYSPNPSRGGDLLEWGHVTYPRVTLVGNAGRAPLHDITSSHAIVGNLVRVAMERWQ